MGACAGRAASHLVLAAGLGLAALRVEQAALSLNDLAAQLLLGPPQLLRSLLLGSQPLQAQLLLQLLCPPLLGSHTLSRLFLGPPQLPPQLLFALLPLAARLLVCLGLGMELFCVRDACRVAIRR